MSNNFTIECNHTRPVQAGTVVSFTAGMADADPDDYQYRWFIRGPYTDAVRELRGGRTLDWDTAGVQPGKYLVWGVRVARQEEAAPRKVSTKTKVGAAGATTEEVTEAAGGGNGTAGSYSKVFGEPPDFGKVKSFDGGPDTSNAWEMFIEAGPSLNRDGVVPVSLQRTALEPTSSQVLWMIIRNRTNAIGFRAYKKYCDGVMFNGTVAGGAPKDLTFRGPEAYELLKRATDAFLMQETGVLDPDSALADIETQLVDPARELRLRIEESRRLGGNAVLDEVRRYRDNYYDRLAGEHGLVLPYLNIIRERLADVPLKGPDELPMNCYGILRSHLTGPLALELFWSYWQEEGMLVQTLNAVMLRFENRRAVRGGRPDPLARFDPDPLRPLSNLLWSWIQDEFHRLSARRRSAEYAHEYGLRLIGKAIPDVPGVDDRRKFLESFHNLLYLTHVFFKEDDDTTVIADAFPVLNALRETHLLLAEGAHNQYGDLPSAARSEMLIMQWMLARPEMRDFLGGRVMVPYEEDWMDRVDTMKQMQGWTDVSVTHFRDMAVFGEQIVLSIRYGNWSVLNDPQEAANWARYWRPEIQRYVHAYRSATGVDLTERVEATMPGELLARRLAGTQRRA
jgi:hypothetical protein